MPLGRGELQRGTVRVLAVPHGSGRAEAGHLDTVATRGLCFGPPEHLERALEVLDMFWCEIVDQRPPSIEETARRYPIATLHVAAAMTAWLYGNPAAVPDRTLTQMKLLKLAEQCVERLYPGRRSEPLRQPPTDDV